MLNRLLFRDSLPLQYAFCQALGLFCMGAIVNVPAAFHVSTANYLKFPDGNFYADTVTASTLSAAPSAAFGFLGTTRAPITVNGGGGIVTTSPLKPINVVGGDVVAGDLINGMGTIGSAGWSQSMRAPLR